MTDILYIAGTIAFFALMVLYVRFCQRLGGRAEPGKSQDTRP
jgi:hypothetical protein